MQVKHPLPTSQRWAVLQWCDIPRRTDSTEVYLRRLRVVQTPWFGAMLHWINTIDEGPYPHDHPWTWFRTIILRGGYKEKFFINLLHFKEDIYQEHTWNRWSMHMVRYTEGHQITDIESSTITLVIHGKRIRRFCFWTKDRGKVPYTQIRPEEFDDVG